MTYEQLIADARQNYEDGVDIVYRAAAKKSAEARSCFLGAVMH